MDMSRVSAMGNEEFVREVAAVVSEGKVLRAQDQLAIVGPAGDFEKDDTLPKGDGYLATEEEQKLREVGFVFLDSVQGNPFLQHARFPPGWKKMAGTDPRYFWLVDGAGQVRARLFLSRLDSYDPDVEIRVIDE